MSIMDFFTGSSGGGGGGSTGGDVDWMSMGAQLIDKVAPSVIKGYGQRQANSELNTSLDKVIEMVRAQEDEDYQNQLAAWEQNNANSAANASAKRAAARKAALLQQAYYEKAQRMLDPYAKAGVAEIPIRQAVYSAGMSGLTDALARSASSLNGMPQGANATGIAPKVRW